MHSLARGRPTQLADGLPALVTIHPSAVLRAGENRAARREELTTDLALARELTTQMSKVTKS